MKLRYWIEGHVGLLKHRNSPPSLPELEQMVDEAKNVEKRLELAEAVCDEAWDCYTSGIWREFNLRLLDKWKAHKSKEVSG